MATLATPDPSASAGQPGNQRLFPAPVSRPWGRPRAGRHSVGTFERGGQFVIDTRNEAPDLFVDASATNWPGLTWKEVGRPYRVEKWARSKHEYEEREGKPLPIAEGWRRFNLAFHQFFLTEGMQLKKPRILFLGAAEGYEAMQLSAMYPGGEIVLVDYDEFCATDRFGKFPLDYPFLGVDNTTGHPRVWYRDEMPVEFNVADIRALRYGREFDVVVSIGLLEHFPDEHKAECIDMHRRFLKPGGYVVMTTPRNQFKSRAYYNLLSDFLNHGYRELMNVRQMGLYAHEAGLHILRAGVIKAHNSLIMKVQ